MITHAFPPVSGGIGQIIFSLCKSLPSEDVAVIAPWGLKTSAYDVLNPKTREAAQEIDSDLEFPVYRVSYSQRSTFATIISILRFTIRAMTLLNREKPELIHLSVAYPLGLVGLVLSRFGIPYVVHTFGSELVKPRGPLARLLRLMALRKAFRVLAISQWGKDTLVEMGVEPDRVEIMHPKVDLTRFEKPSDLESFKQKEGLANKQVILTVGHIIHRKGQHLVIQAMSEVIKEYPDALYVIAGAGPDRPKLEKIVKDSDLAAHVIFPGNRDIVHFYHACDIFIMPSLYLDKPIGDIESFGIVYIEASACGKPAIGSDNGGIPDAVADGESGIIVETDSVPAVVTALKRLLGDSELCQRLGKQGYERVKREFTVDKYAQEYETFIHARLRNK